MELSEKKDNISVFKVLLKEDIEFDDFLFLIYDEELILIVRNLVRKFNKF